jgi:hypothetical protein
VSDERFDRAVAVMAAEMSIRGLLGSACRELVHLLDARACASSRVIGALLVSLDEHTITGRPIGHGHEYLISDFPLTREVVDSGEPRWVSSRDEQPEANEVALLQQLGFESLLMVCLPTSKSCWGLVEVYGEADGFDEESADVAVRFARRTGELLEGLEVPDTR